MNEADLATEEASFPTIPAETGDGEHRQVFRSGMNQDRSRTARRQRPDEPPILSMTSGRLLKDGWMMPGE